MPTVRVLPQTAAKKDTRPFTVPGLDDAGARRAIGKLSDAILAGSASQLLKAGERDQSRDHLMEDAAEEETALAWAARHFARRANDPGMAIHAWPTFRDGGRVTVAAAEKAERALRDALTRGDGAAMMQCSSLVADTYGEALANFGRLRALTWAARTLGERCCNGEFQTVTALVTAPAPACATAP